MAGVMNKRKIRDIKAYLKQAPQNTIPFALPTLHFDAKANAVTMDNQSVQDYVNKLFAPLSPTHLMTDFPGFLRRAADTLAAVKK